MRHVAVATLKDKLSEYLAAAEAGDQLVITRHGREIARIVPPVTDKRAAMRDLVERTRRFSEDFRQKHGPVSSDEIGQWIEEDRR